MIETHDQKLRFGLMFQLVSYTSGPVAQAGMPSELQYLSVMKTNNSTCNQNWQGAASGIGFLYCNTGFPTLVLGQL